MKLTASQIQAVAEKVLDQWKKNHIIEFKDDEKKVLARMVEILKMDYQKELDLEKEVQGMIEELERTHQGEFQKYKMYPILKQKLAKERKVIL